MRLHPTTLRREFERLSEAGLDGEELLLTAADRIAQVVPHDGYCVSRADPRSLVLTDTWTEGIPAQEFATAFFEAEHGRGDFALHRDLVAGRQPAAVLGALTRGEPRRSRRYRQLLEPMGVAHELRAAALASGAPWGFIHLFRRPGRRDFDADELELVQRATPVLAHALRTRAASGSLQPGGLRTLPATVLIDSRLEIVGFAGPAVDLLTALNGRRPAAGLPTAIIGLVLGALLGAPESSATILVEGRGWLSLRAARLEGDTQRETAVVTIEPATGYTLADTLMLAFGMTPAERSVCRLALDGDSNKLIACRLGVSVHTVQGALKQIFAKAGVRSRGELSARLTAS